MSIKVNKSFYTLLDSKAEKGLLAAGELLKKKIKNKLNNSGKVSSPGSSPKKQSGDLYKSIQIKKINNKKIKVGSDLDYAEALEAGNVRMAPRPYLRPSFRENKTILKNIFIKGSK